jgi:hypothetical protein
VSCVGCHSVTGAQLDRLAAALIEARANTHTREETARRYQVPPELLAAAEEDS